MQDAGRFALFEEYLEMGKLNHYLFLCYLQSERPEI